MREAGELFRRERHGRRFLLAHGQSAIGSGAAWVVLLLVAHDRWDSPWAISLVLAADLLPGMLLGPVLGALADRFPRRSCLIAADLARAAAFAAIALTGSFTLTVAFALVAGIGTGLANAAAPAWLPSLVAEERRPAALSLYGSLFSLGVTVGPALAAVLVAVAGLEAGLVFNAVTFAVSAALLVGLPEARHARDGGAARLRDEVRAGLAFTRANGIVAALLLTAGVAGVGLGMINVGEPLLATETLDAGASGFALLVAIFGLGIVGGSLTGARARERAEVRRRYLAGLAIAAAGILGSGLAPTIEAAALTFLVSGIGSGVMLTHQRLIIRDEVPEEMLSRVYALLDTAVAWGLAPALIAGGAIAEAAGPRGIFLVAGAAVALTTAAALPRLAPVARLTPRTGTTSP